MDYELLEVCQSIHETMRDAEHDINKIHNIHVYYNLWLC